MIIYKLNFDVELKEHPYPQAPEAPGEVWGLLTISISAGESHKQLYSLTSDLFGFKLWFLANLPAISQQTLVISGNRPLPQESLAQTINRFQDRDFSEDEQEEQFSWVEELYEYRSRHALRFGFRGLNMVDIFIGLNHGTGEISVSEDTLEWAYPFDMKELAQELPRKLFTIVKDPKRA